MDDKNLKIQDIIYENLKKKLQQNEDNKIKN